MKLGKIISGPADFSFEYFINGGFIGGNCSKCSKSISLYIEIYKTGKPVEQIINYLDESILIELIERKIVKERNQNTHYLGSNKYMLLNMDALYSIILCEHCEANYLSIFGMGELQPGREQVQFKGIWELINK